MGITDLIYFYLYENVDKRIIDFPLVYSMYKIPLILLAYLYFVVYLGPRFMKNREPWSLKTFIKLYNVFQIIANATLVYLFFDAGWYQEIWFYCKPVDYSMDPNALKILNTIWWIIMVKLIDLSETGIYVLRKKNDQMSFLHLYHHISTVVMGWIFFRYVAGGMAVVAPLINCSVHVIMYTYYLLASFGPEVQKIIRPYKWMLTIVQMTQFVILMVHGLQSIMPSCKVPRLPGPVGIVNLMINFYLFYDFYQKTYLKSKEKKK